MSSRIKKIAQALILLLLGLELHASVSGLSIRATTDRSEVYVHAQLILTIEIKSQLHLQNGSLAKPEIPDALMENLIEDEQKEIVEDGIRTLVFVRSYAVFPSKAGLLTIPSVVFEGSVVDPSSGGGLGFFGRGRRLRASTSEIAIQVKPIPSSFPKNQPFLPVQSLTVVESFEDEKTEIGVNKALTRRFEIKALASLASFLPILKTPFLKGCEIYSETGVKNQERSPEGMLARVNFSQVYLPLEPGLVSIPEQVIYWWDTELDQLKTTTIRPFEFNVVGEARTAQPPSSASVPADTKPMPDADAHIENKSLNQEHAKAKWSFVWPLLAALFFMLWLITLGFVSFKKRKALEPAVTSESEQELATLISDVQKACDQGSVPEVLSSLRELIKWSLGHEEMRSMVPKLREPLLALESAVYGQKNISAADVLLDVKKYMSEIKNLKPNKETLVRLYPL